MFNYHQAKSKIDDLINQSPDTSARSENLINIEHSQNVKIVLAKNEGRILGILVFIFLSYTLIHFIF